MKQLTVAELVEFLSNFRGDESVYLWTGSGLVPAVSAQSTENTVTIESA